MHGLDLIAQSDFNNTEYFLYDGLGSVRQLSDGAENLYLTQTYDPYGSVYATAGAGASSFGWTGEQVDGNGLVYLRARYYQPGMGRFLNTDPSRQEKNLYGYATSNPINYMDRTGLSTELSSTVLIHFRDCYDTHIGLDKKVSCSTLGRIETTRLGTLIEGNKIITHGHFDPVQLKIQTSHRTPLQQKS